MMEQFKELHKTVEQLRTSGLSTGEIKKVSGMFYVNNYLLTMREDGNLDQMCFVHHLLPCLSSLPLHPSVHCISYPLCRGGRISVF